MRNISVNIVRSFLKRFLITTVLIGAYFGLWRDFRGLVTQRITIPIIESAKIKSNQYINYESVKPTSTVVYFYDAEINDYDSYLYTTPAGFYFLLGLVFVAIFNGGKFFYKLVTYLNFGIWLLSILFVWIGLHYVDIIFHLALLCSKYLLRGFTFIIIVLLISPNFGRVFNLNLSNEVETES